MSVNDHKDQLVRIYQIQQLALRVSEARNVVEQAPHRIEQIEGHFRERNAEYVAVKDRFDELEADQRQRTSELAELEEHRKKYMDDLMQVKNQREYAAMLKEIDSVKAQIAEHDEAILKDMEEIEKLTGELKTHEEHIAEERKSVARERTEVEAEETEARSNIEQLGAERQKIESGLSLSQRNALHRLEKTRQGIFISKAENCTCLSCFVRIRPQVFQEIKLASKVHTCDSCRRFLYFEKTLTGIAGFAAEGEAKPTVAADAKPDAKPEAAGGAEGGVTINGGAV